MNGPRAVDCQGFAGGFTLGMARAGIEVIAKREERGGFGVPIVDHNRNLINPSLDIQCADPKDWIPRRAEIVFGNPPCSAFATINAAGAAGVMTNTGTTQVRGIDHSINQCMWHLVEYAAACKADIVIMESVQGAFSQGRELMQNLRADMQFRTGRPYDLVHVLQSNASLGGASIRRRYFMVLCRPGLKFGVQSPHIRYVPTLGNLIYDIENSPLQVEWQEYDRRRNPADMYAFSLRSNGFDGHDTFHMPVNQRIEWVMANADWNEGEHFGDATRRAIKNIGGADKLPRIMYRLDDQTKIANETLSTSPFAPRRWYRDKAAGVIMAYASRDFIHPTLPRNLTMRECARVMGYPDDWSLAPVFVGSKIKNQMWLGKGISVPCGEWIGHWAKQTLERDPGAWRGDLIGVREYKIDVSNDFKAVYDERTGERRDSRSKELRRAMEARPA